MTNVEIYTKNPEPLKLAFFEKKKAEEFVDRVILSINRQTPDILKLSDIDMSQCSTKVFVLNVLEVQYIIVS